MASTRLDRINLWTLSGKLVQFETRYKLKLSKNVYHGSCFAYPYGYNMAACLVHPKNHAGRRNKRFPEQQ